MKNVKKRAAAAATVLGLAGLGGVALSSQQQRTGAKVVADRPPVRTEVVRRTIHLTKHAKPKTVATGSVPVASTAYTSAVPLSASGVPVPASAPTTQSAGSDGAPQRSTSRSDAVGMPPSAGGPTTGGEPVVTSPSGGGAATAGDEAHESEHGEHGDHEGEYEGEDD